MGEPISLKDYLEAQLRAMDRASGLELAELRREIAHLHQEYRRLDREREERLREWTTWRAEITDQLATERGQTLGIRLLGTLLLAVGGLLVALISLVRQFLPGG